MPTRIVTVTAPRRHVKNKTTQKTDVAEHPEVFDHVGLLANQPLGRAELLSSSHPTISLEGRDQVCRDSSSAVIVRGHWAKAIGPSALHGSLITPWGSRQHDERSRHEPVGDPAACGSSCVGVAQCARAGSAASGLLLPRPTAGGAP